MSLPLAYPVSILAAGDLASNLRLDRLHVGVMLGGRSGVVAVGSGLRRDGAPQLDRVSVAAFSSNNLLTGRR